jgi:hypothetical protein
MQIDLSERQQLNVPLSSRRICEPDSNLTISTDPAFAKKAGVRTVRDAGITIVLELHLLSR